MLDGAGALTSVDDVMYSFLVMETVFDEHPDTVAERWEAVACDLHWAASRPLYQSFDEELQKVYETGDAVATFAAVEFCMLRWRFFAILDSLDVNMTHVNMHEMDVTSVWHKKLGDRYDQIEDGYIDDDKYVGPVLPAKVKHTWLN